MPAVVQYRLSDGVVVGRWESNQLEIVMAQVVPDDPTYGYRLDTTNLALEDLQAAFYYPGGTETPVQRLTLTAAPSPFAGDGVTQCHVSVSPFVPCTLAVQGQQVELTEADPVLVLTADRPQWLILVLVPLAGYWAEALRVEVT